MNKALLVTDVPESCWGCDCSYIKWAGVDEYLEDNIAFCCPTVSDVKKYCLALLLDANRENKNRKYKPDWCPLKTIPEKYNRVEQLDVFSECFADGYNACIDKIIGEE